MPRKKSRFSALDKKLREEGGIPTGDGRTAKFLQWRTGQRKINVERPLSQSERERVKVAIIPFADDVPNTITDNDRMLVYISKYSYFGWDSRIKSRIAANEMGWAEPGAGNKEGGGNFYPALIKINMTRSGAASVDKISGVTGQSYRYTPSRTFALPFGRTITSVIDPDTAAPPTEIQDVDYEEMISAFLSQLTEPSKLEGFNRVSFEPEVIRKSSSSGEGFGGTINGSGVTVN